MQALLIKRDEIEFAKIRAILQAIVNKEEAQKSLESYRDLQFPYYRKMQQTDRDKHIKQLMSEVSKGPIAVFPMEEKRVKSRLKTRMVKRMTPEQRDIMNRLSKKLPRLM